MRSPIGSCARRRGGNDERLCWSNAATVTPPMLLPGATAWSQNQMVPKSKSPDYRGFSQADARTRTGDPFITSEVLYQLSYVGVCREFV
jgi:hypothetical protein